MGVVERREGFADIDRVKSSDGNDIPWAGCCNIGAFESLVPVQAANFDRYDRSVNRAQGHVLPFVHLPVEDAANGQAPDVRIVIQGGDQELQRLFRVVGRGWHRPENFFQQRGEGRVFAIGFRTAGAGFGIAIIHGEVELRFRCIEIDEQIGNFVQNLCWARIATVNFIDHHNRCQLGFERFAEDKTRLWQWPLTRIHQEHDAVNDFEHALDFAAKVGMSRCVNDINPRAVIRNGRILRHNGDTAFAFQVNRIHDALGHGLVVTKDATLP